MALWKPSRRLFLAGAGLIAAPAIVRAQSPQVRQLLLRQQPASAAAPAFAQGIYFRASALAGPTNYDIETLASGATNYPRVSAQGNNVGWETLSVAMNTADRNVTTDVRLKGIAFWSPNSSANVIYRIDLPSPGVYKIQAALGDSGFPHPQRLRVFDGGVATALIDVDSGSGTVNVPADQWMDATGVIRTTEANWVSNNAINTVTFTTSIARFRFGQSIGTSDTASTVNAIFITQ